MKNSHSEIKVSPNDWASKKVSNLKKDWYIWYFYYSSQFPSGKMIKVKGMNRAKSLDQKQEITKFLIENEISLLSKGYNPITKEFENYIGDLNEKTLFINALQYAYEKINVSEVTRKNIFHDLKIVKKSAINTELNQKEIGSVRKRDIRILLDNILAEGHSNSKYNKIRSHLGILYNYLIDFEIFDFNYIHSIDKLPHTPKKRVILRSEDKVNFNKLKSLNYALWRFCKIFYYSGCRLTELRNVKFSDVDFDNLTFTIFEKKGKRYHNVIKPINHEVKNLWGQLFEEKGVNDIFVFGNELKPSVAQITEGQLYHRWKRWSAKVGIKVHLYALRHTYLNDITKKYGIPVAKGLAGHTNERTTMIYAVDYQDDLLNERRNVSTGF